MLVLFKIANNPALLKEYIRSLLKGSKFEGHIFLVGGSVRDSLLSKPIKDLDFVVDLQGGGIEAAEYLGGKIDKQPVIYERFGTAMLNFDGLEFNGYKFDKSDEAEFVQTRKEQYRSKSRKPDTEFGSIKDDAFRRDFTVNALYQDLFTDEIIDVTGMGKKDLKDGILRTTSDAASIFEEDPLRMLRAIRFAFKLKKENGEFFSLSPEVKKGLMSSAESIKDISHERVRDELNKILLLENPDKAVKLMREVGLLSIILPELERLHGLTANPKHHKHDAFDHTLEVLANVPSELPARLSGLMHDIGKSEAKQWLESAGYYRHIGHEDAGEVIVREVLSRLKYPSDIIETVASVVSNHMWSVSEAPTQAATARLLNKLKADVNLLIMVMEADRIHSREGDRTKSKEILDTMKQHIENIRNVAPTMKVKPPVSGNDIMDRFDVKPGPEVGRLLNLAMEYYYDHPEATKDEILQYLEEHKTAYCMIMKMVRGVA